MRTILGISMVGFALGLAANLVRADGPKDHTPELDAVARAFLKAYRAKDLNAALESADAPFLVGTLRNPRVLKTTSDLRTELQARQSAVGTFPSKVAKTLTWEKATSSPPGAGNDSRTREKLRPAIAITGEDGGYAALADSAGNGRKSRLLAISDTRLLVGIRGGKAKVVGILVDDAGMR